jgi:Fatty acid hydroxylase superfamily
MRLFRLEHSQWAYQADFALYTIASALMAAYLLIASPSELKLPLAGMAVVGLVSWPFIEYALHRFILHGLKPFSTWHAAHHQRPHALICTPTVLSASLITLLVFVPAMLLTDIWLATALTFGLLTGYLAYAITHHAIHHWHGNSAWFKQRKHCHALHHNPRRPPAHFGVTSSVCDSLTGTAH